MSALELTLRALEIGAGDEVITAANTFVATVFAIAHVDATPRARRRGSEDLHARTRRGPRGHRSDRAIVPVHLYGQPADMDSLGAIAQSHGLLLIEDACQATAPDTRANASGRWAMPPPSASIRRRISAPTATEAWS